MTLRSSYPVPPDFVSDGCSVPRILRGLYARYTKACRWHDWARRHLVHYGVLTVQQADAEFHSYLRALGMSRALARITWLVVKLTRDKYSRTLPVPKAWEKYLKPTA